MTVKGVRRKGGGAQSRLQRPIATESLSAAVGIVIHRFTPTSKAVLRDWYPGSDLDLDEAARARRRTPFGATKFVYPAAPMREMREALTGMVADRRPGAKVLYWI